MTDTDSAGDTQKQRRILLEDKAVRKEMDAVPEKIQDQFLLSLEMARLGLPPALKSEKLKAAGDGVIELKINGSPAYRCMYVLEENGDVLVLHVTKKTTEGQSKQLVNTTSERLKRLRRRR